MPSKFLTAQRSIFLALIGFPLALWLAWRVYGLGLGGLFLFDDLPNLQALSGIDETDTLRDMLVFSIEGAASALGRPLALFSFALQYQAWPHDPAAFKAVNILLHLLNGCLSFWLAWLLARRLDLSEAGAAWAGLLTASLWLLNPMHISTVLYVVQRMAQLSALFTLVGLVLYVKGRLRLAAGSTRTGYLCMTLGVAGAGLLATLGKETGVLILLYVLVLEATLLRDLPWAAGGRAWRTGFVYAPLLVLLGYFTLNADSVILAGYEGRDFSLFERLLTQPRMLFEYLASIFSPRPSSFGLLHDDVIVSRGLLSPPTTVLAVMGLLIALAGALLVRKTRPVLSFAVLWFLAGHVLESTVFPLNLYFEHRNYLPMLGLMFGLAAGLVMLAARSRRRIRVVVAAVVLAWLSLHTFITAFEARLWGDSWLQSQVWAREHPESMDNLANALMRSAIRGDSSQSLEYIKAMIAARPDRLGVFMHWLALACMVPDTPSPDMDDLVEYARNIPVDLMTLAGMNNLLNLRMQEVCAFPDNRDLEQLLAVLEANPANREHLADLYHLHALLVLEDDRLEDAIDLAGRALRIREHIPLLLDRIYWLILTRRYDEAGDALREIGDRRGMGRLKMQLYSDRIGVAEKLLRDMREHGDADTGGAGP